MKNNIYILFFYLILCQSIIGVELAEIENKELGDININCIYKDHQGFLWIGSSRGLYRYDGYDFVHFRYNPKDSTGISNSFVNDIAEDEDSLLWIATDYGLNILDRKKMTFKRYFATKGDSSSLSHNSTRKLLLDPSGNFWIGTRKGLNKLIKENDHISFKQYYPPRVHKTRTNEWSIVDLIHDPKGDIWVATYGGGLLRLNHNRFTEYISHPDSHYSISNNIVREIKLINDSSFYLIASDADINIFDLKTQKFYHKENSSWLNAFSYGDIIYCIEEDYQNNIWIGGNNHLYLYKPHEKEFTNPEIVLENNPGKTLEFVKVLYEDNNHILWIGTNDGLKKYDPYKNKFLPYQYLIPSKDRYEDYITDVIELNGHLWLATHGDGILKTDTNLSYFERKNLSSQADMVLSLCLDSAENVWIGTESGVLKFLPEEDTFIPINNPNLHLIKDHNIHKIDHLYYDHHKNVVWALPREGKLFKIHVGNLKAEFDPLIGRMPFTKHTAIYRDKNLRLWIGSNEGLACYDPHLDKIEFFYHRVNNPTSLADNWVTTIFQDKDSNIWVGTVNGLSLFQEDKRIFTNYDINNGLISQAIKGMVEHHNSLWILTPQGLSVMDKKDESFRNFGKTEGIPKNAGHIMIDEHGFVLIAGEKKFLRFDPNQINTIRSIHSPLYFTSFYLGGEKIESGDYPLNASITETKKITLKHSKKTIAFKFAALNYTHTDKIRYAYRLEGFDTSWNNLGDKREVTLMNLPHGDYRLLVKSFTNGVQNESQAEVAIKILPPWWRSRWANTILIGIIILSLYLYKYFSLKKEKMKRYLEMERLKADKIQEINNLKFSFYFNISHELKTPLTLILGPLWQLLKGEDNTDKRNKLSLIKKNVDRLRNLIDQLLDLRKLELGKLKANVVRASPNHLIHKIVSLFIPYAEQNNIQFINEHGALDGLLYIDEDKVEKIITNLLSNAIKFTPEGGEIVFNTEIINHDEGAKAAGMIPILQNDFFRNNRRLLKIIISDSGEGMEAEGIETAFERFGQITHDPNKIVTGTGIGLSLVKEMVYILHGELYIKSSPEKGTTFMLLLPTESSDYNKDEISPVKTPSPSPKKEDNESIHHLPSKSCKEVDYTNEQVILVVEDNKDLLSFLSELLSQEYKIIKSENGRKAIKHALNEQVDLIISDIMMPKMDGIELCRQIKENFKISHIPVLLLTAKNTTENIEEGFAIGADAYMTKPFEPDILLARVKNLLKNREILWKKFAEDKDVLPDKLSISKNDELFLKKAYKFVENNLSDSQLSKADLCEELGMSQAQLYRKLRTLTNQSVHEFIRIIRLKKAARILKQGKPISIANLGYDLGFNNPNYFTRMFKEYFGKTPTQYQQDHSNL